MSPRELCFAPCKCGNENLQWSEYEKHVWCNKCNIDFVPESNGILDGPIMIETCDLMGITFHSFDMTSNQIVKFDSEFWPYSEKR